MMMPVATATNEPTGAACYPTYAYVGCFTERVPGAHGKGVSVYRIDQSTGAWTLVQLCETAPDPAFLALDRDQKFLYVAHSAGTDFISAYSIERPTGALRLLNAQATDGSGSVHVTVDLTNRYVVLANGPGVAVFPINKDGSLAPASDRVVPPGEASLGSKYDGPHPHDVVFDPRGRFIVAPDAGLDRIHIYRWDSSRGKLTPNDFPFANSRSGAGPRHIAFHPAARFAYVINASDSTVAVYSWDAERGALKPIQIVDAIPPDFTGKKRGSEIAIAPSGRFLYASNRGHDSIAVFSINVSNGMLDLVSWEPAQGKNPRFFALNPRGSLLYAANVDSDSIAIFRVDATTGALTPTGQIIETPSPTCIAFCYR